VDKGNNKITELRTILQRESQNSYLYKQTKSVNNRKTVKTVMTLTWSKVNIYYFAIQALPNMINTDTYINILTINFPMRHIKKRSNKPNQGKILMNWTDDETMTTHDLHASKYPL
jgi:hypothetical protein